MHVNCWNRRCENGAETGPREAGRSASIHIPAGVSLRAHESWRDEFEKRDRQTIDEGTVRYALVSLGWWTRGVAIPAIENTDPGEVSILVSSSAERAERASADHDIEYPDGRHGLVDVRVIEAIHEAAERSEPVALR